MNLELGVPLRERKDGDGVVKVLRRFAVNGNDGQIAKVPAAGDFFSGDGCGEGACFSEGVVREFVQQVVFPDDDLDVYAEVVTVSENLDDLAGRALGRRREADHFDIYDQAVQFWTRLPLATSGAAGCPRFSRSGHLVRKNPDVVLNSFVERDHEGAARMPTIFPNQRGVCALQDSFNTSFCAPEAADPSPADHYAVAVHAAAHGVRAYIDVAARLAERLVRDDEAVAVSVADQPSGDRCAATTGPLFRCFPVAVESSWHKGFVSGPSPFPFQCSKSTDSECEPGMRTSQVIRHGAKPLDTE